MRKWSPAFGLGFARQWGVARLDSNAVQRSFRFNARLAGCVPADGDQELEGAPLVAEIEQVGVGGWLRREAVESLAGRPSQAKSQGSPEEVPTRPGVHVFEQRSDHAGAR